jgi:pyroglutamyl-peptidase
MIAEGDFMRVLLTGFEPFGAIAVNPSQRIIEHFQAQRRDDLITRILPTEYQRAGECIDEAIRSTHPDAVISLGVAQSRKTISLERIAVNVDDASIADNAGHLASGEVIAPDGPAAYWTTLPIDAMKAALEAHNIPVSISNHAGAYICNHVFYTGRYTLDALGRSIPCGFIHVPDLLRVDGEITTGLALEIMIEAVELCLQVVANTSQR